MSIHIPNQFSVSNKSSLNNIQMNVNQLLSSRKDDLLPSNKDRLHKQPLNNKDAERMLLSSKDIGQKNFKKVLSSSRIDLVDQSLGVDTQQSVYSITQNIEKMCDQTKQQEIRNYEFLPIKGHKDCMELISGDSLKTVDIEGDENLKNMIQQLTNNLESLSIKYQSLKAENEALKCYDQNKTLNPKIEMKQHLEQRHQEQVKLQQDNWNKEKSHLISVLNSQKFRILDNERIMLQMEGDLERIKEIICQQNQHTNEHSYPTNCQSPLIFSLQSNEKERDNEQVHDSNRPLKIEDLSPASPSPPLHIKTQVECTSPNQLQYLFSSNSTNSSPLKTQHKRFGSMASTNNSEISQKINLCSSYQPSSPSKVCKSNIKNKTVLFTNSKEIDLNINSSKKAININKDNGEPNQAYLMINKRSSVGIFSKICLSPTADQKSKNNSNLGNKINIKYFPPTHSQVNMNIQSSKNPQISGIIKKFDKQSVDQKSVTIFKRFQQSLHLLD